MKLKDLVSIARNKTNKQTNLTLKKRRMKDIDMTENEILDIEIHKFFKRK